MKYFFAFKDTPSVVRSMVNGEYMETHRTSTEYRIIPEDEWDDYCSTAWHKSSAMTLHECRVLRIKTLIQRGSPYGNTLISKDDYHTRLW